MTTPTTMAVLRVFDVPDEDGMRRYWDAHATNGALELEPGHYELVLRRQPICAKPDLMPCDCRRVCKRAEPC